MTSLKDVPLRKLTEVCEIIMGQSPPSLTYNVVGKGLPFFQGKSEFGRRFTTVRKWCTEPKKKAKKNDILMSVRAPVGPVNIADQDCAVGRGLCAIRVKEQVELLYVYHYLKSIEEKIANQGSGSTFKAINKKQVETLTIPVPSIDEQKRIISILEKAEKLKDRREKANKETNKIAQSLFYEMFSNKGYPLRTLLDLSREKPQYGSGAKAVPYDGKTRYIRITDITSKGNLQESVVSPSEFSEKYVLENRDLLFARSGATVGKTYLHRSNDESSIYAGYLIRFRFSEEVNPAYVYAFTKTSQYEGWIKKTQTQVAQPNINAKQYGSLEIPLPPIELQNKFAEKVKQIEKIKERQTKPTEDINQLFDALMQKAFSGGLQ